MMGLDMTFYKVKKDIWDKFKETRNFDYFWDHSKEILYLRKANQIQGWLANNLKDYNDNDLSVIQIDEIKRLLEIIKQILEDHTLAPKLLPTTIGFFFGPQDYDEWYFNGLKRFQENFLKVLDKLESDDLIIYCESY